MSELENLLPPMRARDQSFLVLAGNFTLTMDFYWSYTLTLVAHSYALLTVPAVTSNKS